MEREVRRWQETSGHLRNGRGCTGILTWLGQFVSQIKFLLLLLNGFADVRRFEIETEPNPTPTKKWKQLPNVDEEAISRHRFRNFHDSTRHCFRSRDYPTSFVASRDRSDYFQDLPGKPLLGLFDRLTFTQTTSSCRFFFCSGRSKIRHDMLWSTMAFVSKEALQKMQPIVE